MTTRPQSLKDKGLDPVVHEPVQPLFTDLPEHHAPALAGGPVSLEGAVEVPEQELLIPPHPAEPRHVEAPILGPRVEQPYYVSTLPRRGPSAGAIAVGAAAIVAVLAVGLWVARPREAPIQVVDAATLTPTAPPVTEVAGVSSSYLGAPGSGVWINPSPAPLPAPSVAPLPPRVVYVPTPAPAPAMAPAVRMTSSPSLAAPAPELAPPPAPVAPVADASAAPPAPVVETPAPPAPAIVTITEPAAPIDAAPPPAPAPVAETPL